VHLRVVVRRSIVTLTVGGSATSARHSVVVTVATATVHLGYLGLLLVLLNALLSCLTAYVKLYYFTDFMAN